MQLKGLRAAVADASAKAEGIIAADKTNDPEAVPPSYSLSSPSAATAAASSSRANATSTPGVAPAAAASSARDKAALGLAPTSDVGPGGNTSQRKAAMVTAEATTAASTSTNANAPPPRGKNSSGKGGGQAGGGAVSTWAHARAALLLRTEGVAVALQWVASSKMIQASLDHRMNASRVKKNDPPGEFREYATCGALGWSVGGWVAGWLGCRAFGFVDFEVLKHRCPSRDGGFSTVGIKCKASTTSSTCFFVHSI